MLDYFFKGFVIGLSVAAPVGLIGVLTIKRTLSEGRLAGFITGLGAAVADACYGLVAALGLTAISVFLIEQSLGLKLIGGIFLLYFGVQSFRSKPAEAGTTVTARKGLVHHFVSTYFLTMTNPSTVLSFLGIFAALGLGSVETGYAPSANLVAGVFAGSACWWLLLSTLIGTFRWAVTPDRMVWINRLLGIIIIFFGLWVLYSIL